MRHDIRSPGSQRALRVFQGFGVSLLPVPQQSEVVEREHVLRSGAKRFEPFLFGTVKIASVEIDGAEIVADQACVPLLKRLLEQDFFGPPVSVARHRFHAIWKSYGKEQNGDCARKGTHEDWLVGAPEAHCGPPTNLHAYPFSRSPRSALCHS